MKHTWSVCHVCHGTPTSSSEYLLVSVASELFVAHSPPSNTACQRNHVGVVHDKGYGKALKYVRTALFDCFGFSLLDPRNFVGRMCLYAKEVMMSELNRRTYHNTARTSWRADFSCRALASLGQGNRSFLMFLMYHFLLAVISTDRLWCRNSAGTTKPLRRII